MRQPGVVTGRWLPPATGQAAPSLFPADDLAAGLTVVTYGKPITQGSHIGIPLWAGAPCGACKRRALTRVLVKEQTERHLLAWRRAIGASAVAALAGRAALDGPLAWSLVFTVRRPASGDHMLHPDGPPDWDKLVRAAFDAVVKAGAVADDARFVWCDYGGKVYPGDGRPDTLDRPGAVFRIHRAD